MKVKTITDLTIDALNTDGAHHKQWYLWRILEAINPKAHEILIKTYGKEDGIIP